MSVQVVILAAGVGSRMHSALPKVLHHLGGKPLLQHVIETAIQVSPDCQPIIVYGHQGTKLQTELGHFPVIWVEQKEQLGTAHAVLQALPQIKSNHQILILYGDVPLISANTLQKLMRQTPQEAVGLLTAFLADPSGYGRIKRDEQGKVQGIVEEKDSTEVERSIREINPGIYFLSATHLQKWLVKIQANNAQGEYYLTDIIMLAKQEQIPIYTHSPENCEEAFGINDCAQLAILERYYQLQTAKRLLKQGVTLLDPNRFDIRGEAIIGRDVIIDVNVVMEGRVVIGDGCLIGANTFLKNVVLGKQVEVKANSVIDGAEIAEDCIIGPFARIRPGTVLSAGAHVGNFVEVKNSWIGEGSKINHLSYVGDSEIGKRVNIGAGTITCNYDGMNKHKTIIGDDTHIGSDTQLVAPVTVGAGATIGAGSTITKDVPPNKLTLTHRIEQRIIKDWQRPDRKE